jgi:hypothetical protein
MITAPEDKSNNGGWKSKVDSQSMKGYAVNERTERMFYLPNASVIKVVGIDDIDANRTKLQLKAEVEAGEDVPRFGTMENIDGDSKTVSENIPNETESQTKKEDEPKEFTFGNHSKDNGSQTQSMMLSVKDEHEKHEILTTGPVAAHPVYKAQSQRDREPSDSLFLLERPPETKSQLFSMSFHEFDLEQKPSNFFGIEASSSKVISKSKKQHSNSFQLERVGHRSDSDSFINDSDQFNLYNNHDVSRSESDNCDSENMRFLDKGASPEMIRLYGKEDTLSIDSAHLLLDDEILDRYKALLKK